jgi:hypothetical protein
MRNHYRMHRNRCGHLALLRENHRQAWSLVVEANQNDLNAYDRLIVALKSAGLGIKSITKINP